MKNPKRIIATLILLISFLFISGCKDNSDNSADRNKDFVINIYTDKSKYNADEQIDCYATVQYIGNAENITIYLDVPSVVFAIKHSNGYGFGGTSLLMMVEDVFNKDETKTYGYVKSGGYDENSPEWVKEFLSDEDFNLPRGTYTIIAYFEYSHAREGSTETLKVSKTIKVT